MASFCPIASGEPSANGSRRRGASRAGSSHRRAVTSAAAAGTAPLRSGAGQRPDRRPGRNASNAMLPVWLEPSDPGLGPSSTVSASSRRWRSPRKITPGSRGASRWRTSRLGRSSTSSTADSLFHLAGGLDQPEGCVLTNPIAHQIGIQNPASRAQIGGFCCATGRHLILNIRLFFIPGYCLFPDSAVGASISWLFMPCRYPHRLAAAAPSG